MRCLNCCSATWASCKDGSTDNTMSRWLKFCFYFALWRSTCTSEIMEQILGDDGKLLRHKRYLWKRLVDRVEILTRAFGISRCWVYHRCWDWALSSPSGDTRKPYRSFMVRCLSSFDFTGLGWGGRMYKVSCSNVRVLQKQVPASSIFLAFFYFVSDERMAEQYKPLTRRSTKR